MKRLDIRYGGDSYTLAGRKLAEVQDEIVEAVSRGEAMWLAVNEGEGGPRPAYLLISPGVALSFVPVPDPES